MNEACGVRISKIALGSWFKGIFELIVDGHVGERPAKLRNLAESFFEQCLSHAEANKSDYEHFQMLLELPDEKTGKENL